MKMYLLQTLGEVCIAMVVYHRIEATILLSFCDAETRNEASNHFGYVYISIQYIYIYAIRIQDILNNYH